MLSPLADVITPNIPEMEVLSGMTIQTDKDMERAAKSVGDTCHCAVLCKGGHQLNDANDLLYAEGEIFWFYGKRIATSNTHGTGCTLSSACLLYTSRFMLPQRLSRLLWRWVTWIL